MKTTRLAALAVLAVSLALALVMAPEAESQTANACATWLQTSGTVGTTPTALASTASTKYATGTTNALGQLRGRRYITVCQSKATSSATAILTVRADGYTFGQYPVDAGFYADAGAVDAGLSYYDGGPNPSPGLAWGDCISYPIGDQTIPYITSTEASTYWTAFECSGMATP